MSFTKSLSSLLHTREDGLILVICILSGYPLAALHRTVFYNKSEAVQHIFFVTAGIILYIFSYGLAVLHSIVSIIFAYLIVTYLRGTKASVVAAHLVFLGHLMVGYSYAETDRYDINWTTPFCTMTLRFIGLVMDVYDGHKPKSQRKAGQMETAIEKSPGILEIAAYGYFFSGTFVGPLFPMTRFRAFVGGEYLDEMKEVRSSSLMPSLGRFSAACIYTVIYLWGALWIPNDFFNSDEFYSLPFWWKVFWITLWFRLTMCRYLSCWLFTEGAAILSGIAYNGKNDRKEDLWDGVRYVHLWNYEFGLDFQSVIDSFNVGTNTFAKNHIYRRLRWLGSRTYSHLITLVYLAVWHGYHLGYFVLFALEFACVLAEKQFYALLSDMPNVSKFLAQPYMYPAKLVFGRVIINVTMGVGFLSFGLVKTRLWFKPLLSVYFFVHLFFMVVWPIFYRYIKIFIRRTDSVNNKIE